eukprot:6475196-Amphidinium_carterae.1
MLGFAQQGFKASCMYTMFFFLRLNPQQSRRSSLFLEESEATQKQSTVFQSWGSLKRPGQKLRAISIAGPLVELGGVSLAPFRKQLDIKAPALDNEEEA